ncbi:MAG: hypothetical protein IPL55_04615 [Saprospiraceae bacterium]|jgi:hypothetical protein|nr:hypothetical protein [Saprospiraceae bacterium]MBL0027417.1 hypothetical protein [Saprospiraceae bacterium]
MKSIKILIVIWFSIALSNDIKAQYSPQFSKNDTSNFVNMFDFKPSLFELKSKNVLVKKFDASTLPLFCKLEYQIESKSKVAFRFRLGDLNYVNMLENKR